MSAMNASVDVKGSYLIYKRPACVPPAMPCSGLPALKVYLASWRETAVAAKVLLTPDQLEESVEMLVLPDATMRELHKEAAIMAQIRHPNVVPFLGICSMPPCILTGEVWLGICCTPPELSLCQPQASATDLIPGVSRPWLAASFSHAVSSRSALQSTAAMAASATCWLAPRAGRWDTS